MPEIVSTNSFTDSMIEQIEDVDCLEGNNEIQLMKDDIEKVVNKIEKTSDDEETEGEWLDILGSGDLKKRIIKPGAKNIRPVKGCTVIINAVGKLENGSQIDEHKNLCFTLGDGETILGLELSAPLMKKGEIADVYMASRFAYGAKGLPPLIPSDVNITYTVELLDFTEEQCPTATSLTERMAIGNRKRERGNWWFNREEYASSIQCYTAAIDFLDDAEEEYWDDIQEGVQDILKERLKALNNMAAAQMKIEAYDVAIKSLDSVLKCEPNNVKALFRKGKVCGILGKYEEAVGFLKKALNIEPESRLIHHELSKVRELYKSEQAKEQSLYRKMLGLTKSKNATDEYKDARYPVLRDFPFRSWLKIFLMLVVVLFTFRYRSGIYGIFKQMINY